MRCSIPERSGNAYPTPSYDNSAFMLLLLLLTMAISARTLGAELVRKTMLLPCRPELADSAAAFEARLQVRVGVKLYLRPVRLRQCRLLISRELCVIPLRGKLGPKFDPTKLTSSHRSGLYAYIKVDKLAKAQPEHRYRLGSSLSGQAAGERLGAKRQLLPALAGLRGPQRVELRLRRPGVPRARPVAGRQCRLTLKAGLTACIF